MKKKFVYPAFIFTLLFSLALYGGSKAFADELDTYPPIVRALAEKLGVDEGEIEEVFDQERVIFHEERIQMHQNRLDEAVSNGVITEDQKNALIEKHQELQAEREAYRLQHKEEMDTWFEEQGIDPERISEYAGFGSKEHGMRMGMRGLNK